jgi:hypothetical protein
MFMIHDTLPNPKKMKKIQCPPIKSFFYKGNGFFLEIKVYYAFIAQKTFTNTFFD